MLDVILIIKYARHICLMAPTAITLQELWKYKWYYILVYNAYAAASIIDPFLNHSNSISLSLYIYIYIYYIYIYILIIISMRVVMFIVVLLTQERLLTG